MRRAPMKLRTTMIIHASRITSFVRSEGSLLLRGPLRVQPQGRVCLQPLIDIM